MRRLLHLLFTVGGGTVRQGWKDALKRARHPVIFMAFFPPVVVQVRFGNARGRGSRYLHFFYYFQL